MEIMQKIAISVTMDYVYFNTRMFFPTAGRIFLLIESTTDFFLQFFEFILRGTNYLRTSVGSRFKLFSENNYYKKRILFST